MDLMRALAPKPEAREDGEDSDDSTDREGEEEPASDAMRGRRQSRHRD